MCTNCYLLARTKNEHNERKAKVREFELEMARMRGSMAEGRKREEELRLYLASKEAEVNNLRQPIASALQIITSQQQTICSQQAVIANKLQPPQSQGRALVCVCVYIYIVRVAT